MTIVVTVSILAKEIRNSLIADIDRACSNRRSGEDRYSHCISTTTVSRVYTKI